MLAHACAGMGALTAPPTDADTASPSAAAPAGCGVGHAAVAPAAPPEQFNISRSNAARRRRGGDGGARRPPVPLWSPLLQLPLWSPLLQLPLWSPLLQLPLWSPLLQLPLWSPLLQLPLPLLLPGPRRSLRSTAPRRPAAAVAAARKRKGQGAAPRPETSASEVSAICSRLHRVPSPLASLAAAVAARSSEWDDSGWDDSTPAPGPGYVIAVSGLCTDARHGAGWITSAAGCDAAVRRYGRPSVGRSCGWRESHCVCACAAAPSRHHAAATGA
eukprot:gene11726-39664_t